MKKFLYMLVIMSMLLSACILGEDVEQNEFAVIKQRNAILTCVGAGNYWDGGWYVTLDKYSLSTRVVEVNDPQVLTKDKQPVNVTVAIQVRRLGDCDSAKNLYTNWVHLLNDEALQAHVDSQAREAIKNGVILFTLDGIIGDRDGLADNIQTALESNLADASIEVVDISTKDIGVNPDYIATLEKAAQLKVQEDYELRRKALIEQEAATNIFEKEQEQLVLEQQLQVEQAQTEIQLELARRENEVKAEQNRVYLTNPQAYNLEVLRLYDLILDGQVIYFLPEGSGLNLFGAGTKFVPQ